MTTVTCPNCGDNKGFRLVDGFRFKGVRVSMTETYYHTFKIEHFTCCHCHSCGYDFKLERGE